MPAKKSSRRKTTKKVARSAKAQAQWRILSQILISSALISILLSVLGYLGTDIWLASTQWLVVAAVLAGLGIYAKLESQ